MSGRIITINRLYGSNGRRLGKALSERLGIRFYDSELLKLASERKGIPYEELVKVDEKRASMWRYPVEDEYQMSPQYRSEPSTMYCLMHKKRLSANLQRQRTALL